MYKVKPLGLKTKGTDLDVEDGFLKESINLQWRDDAFRPIPERIVSDIDTSGYEKIILHKVADENQINVLGFETGSTSLGGDLALDLAGFLGGSLSQSGYLTWFGTILDGAYAPITPVYITGISHTDGLSFTILQGIIYFMGDGSSSEEQYYKSLQYNNNDGLYSVKDMYAWKSLIPYYPVQVAHAWKADALAYNTSVRCGIILMRYTLSLDTGEEVMHSPIYGFSLLGINLSDIAIAKGDLIENIHTLINVNFEFEDTDIMLEEVSAINIYLSAPYYETEFQEDVSDERYRTVVISDEQLRGEFQRLAEAPFYLAKTFSPEDLSQRLLLTVGVMSPDLSLLTSPETIQLDISSIAAGEIMPVDSFSHHKLYGRITSAGGRLIVERPTTLLSSGHLRSLKTKDEAGVESYKIDTEDGTVYGITGVDDKNFELVSQGIKSRGLISYPDARASFIYALSLFGLLYGQKARANKVHNLACSFSFNAEGGSNIVLPASTTEVWFVSDYSILLYYLPGVSNINPEAGRSNLYTSENRAQFSAPGEFRSWPAINSYRFGEGRLMRIGVNNIDTANVDIVSPFIAGTSDGVYTINLDPSGNNLVASITQSAPIPYISEEILQITDTKLGIFGMVLFVSDKGLMAVNNGKFINLTEEFFPEQGGGEFPAGETVYPNYNTLTNSYFGGANPYVMGDVVDYMKGAIFAYDARRNTVWCCNPNENFSMVFSLRHKIWGMSTTVFTEKVELFSTLGTAEGDIYSRYMLKNNTNSNLLILSGEDPDTEVWYHLLTRPIKMQYPNAYKKLRGLFSRCELFRSSGGTGYFSFGAWGKQDQNKHKKGIPITAKSDNRAAVYPGNVRQDIPVGWRKGKYKSVTVLQGGLTLPDSSINSLDFDAVSVDKTRTR